MTTASFSKINGRFCGFCVSGHSGYGEDFDVKDGKLRLYAKPVDDSVHDAIDGLHIHLSQLAFQYPEFLRVCTVSFAG